MANAQIDGFLANPTTARLGGVLVLHAWWGLNDTIKAFCRRLAEAGYVAFAPDLYHGQVTNKVDQAESLSSALFEDLNQPRGDLAEATAFLGEQVRQDGGGLAVIGFSLGAFFALDLSISDPERVRSVVVYYGTRPGDYSRSGADYLGHFAELDEFEPQASVDELEGALQAAGRPVRIYRYPGTGHWFAEADRADAFNQSAAELAWERTLAFLGDSLTDDVDPASVA